MSFTISYLSSSLGALLSLITRGVRDSPLCNITLLNIYSSSRRNLPKDASCLVFGSRTIFQFIIKCVCLCAWDGLINLERGMDKKGMGRKAQEEKKGLSVFWVKKSGCTTSLKDFWEPVTRFFWTEKDGIEEPENVFGAKRGKGEIVEPIINTF